MTTSSPLPVPFPAVRPRPAQCYGVYPLTELDRQALVEHFLSLSPQMRLMRFGQTLDDERIRAWAHKMSLDGTTLGYFVWGALRAVVHLVPYPEDGQRAELAVSAHESLRGRGWGARLVHMALDAAAARGVRTVDVYFQRANVPMARIVRKLPGQRQFDGHEAHLQVDVSDWESSALERLALAGGLGDGLAEMGPLS